MALLSFLPSFQERLLQEERQRQVEQDLDYLAPFLIQMGGVEKMTKWLALRLKEECLNDFKHRLVDKANLIQARFEKVPGPSPLPVALCGLELKRELPCSGGACYFFWK